jgi:type VI secretion system secreted protein Hcp
MSSSLVGSAQNRTGGAPVVSPIICTKALDSSSPLLAAEAAVGQTGRTITIEWVSAGSNVTYLKWELENCLISSFTTNSSGSDRPTEAFGISWVKLTTTFTKMDQNNQPAGNVVSVIDLSTVTSS